MRLLAKRINTDEAATKQWIDGYVDTLFLTKSYLSLLLKGRDER